MPRRRHARSGARARPPGPDRHARTGEMLRPRRLERGTAGRARLLDRAQPAARPGVERPVTERVTLVPGSVPLSAWRGIYFGADVTLDPGCRSAVEAGAETIA